MAKKTDVWMPVYIGDLLADTLHLSPEEFGAYHFIMYHQWRTGPIPARALRSVTRMNDEQWRESEATLKAFLTLDENGCYYQARCAKEKVRSDGISEVNRMNGSLGGRPKNQTESELKPNGKANGNPNHKRIETQSQSQSHEEKVQKPLASTADAVPADRGRLLGTLPCAGGKAYEIHEDDLQRDVGLFPGVDVGQEYRSMKAWLLASPKRQKTRSGIRKFMASWLTRAQDSPKPQAGVANGNFASKTESSLNAAEQAIAIQRSRKDHALAGEAWSAPTGEAGNRGLLGAG